MHIFTDKNNQRVCLVHIPKCAGTSCGNFLKKYARNHKWINLEDGYYNDHIPLHVAHKITKWDYSICFVRNPINRFKSKYSYLTQTNFHPGYQNYSIDEFLQQKINLNESGCWTPEGWRKQYEYLEGIDTIYKIEDTDPINILCRITGVQKKHKKMNMSNSNFNLSNAQLQQIYDIFDKDFAKLNYD